VRASFNPSTCGGLLVHARWPEADQRWRDEWLEARFEFAQELVTRLREVRARYQVAPSARVPVVIRAGGEAATRLAGLEELVRGMAGCASVTIDAAAQKPKDAATAVVHDVEAFVLGVVDVEAERARLDKQRGELAGRIEGVRKKLGNQGFVRKAPPEVVEGERTRLADLERQLQSVEAALAAL